MAAAITCASCQRPLRIPENVLGRLVHCPLCLEEFVARADPAAEAAVRDIEKSPQRTAARSQPIAAPIINKLEIKVEEGEEIPAWIEPDVETALPKKPAREVRPVQSLVFPVLVTRDPDRILRGRMEAELRTDGLYLRKPRQAMAFAAVGGGACYLGTNRLVVTIEGRDVELTVVKPWTSVYHLARDTAGFLDGKGAFPDGRVYQAPWLLYALPFLFVVLPFAACPFDLLTDGCGGVLLWCLIAAVLAGATFAVLLQPRLLPRTRLIGAGALVGLGALIYLLAFFFTPSDAVDASLWRTYMPPEGGFHVKLPGSPAFTRKPTGAFIADPAHDTVTYTVDVKGSEVRFAVSVSVNPTLNGGLNQFFGNDINNIQAINDARNRLQQEYLLTFPTGRDVTVSPINGLPYHEVSYRTGPDLAGQLTAPDRTLVARIYVVAGRTYTLVVVGPKVRADSPDALKFFDSLQINQPVIGNPWLPGR